MKRIKLIVLLVAMIVLQPTDLTGQSCQKCEDSVCPSSYVWVEPGEDILAIGSRTGCVWVSDAACPMAIECRPHDDMATGLRDLGGSTETRDSRRLDLDALALLAAEGDAGDIIAEINRHPHTLELVARRHAMAVRHVCSGRLLALLPVHEAAMKELARAVAPLAALSQMGSSTGPLGRSY